MPQIDAELKSFGATYQVLLEKTVDRPQVVAVVRPDLRVARYPRGIETVGVQGKQNIRVARFQEIQRDSSWSTVFPW
jgi:hypothetical protein